MSKVWFGNVLKKGINIHKRRKHTNFEKEHYLGDFSDFKEMRKHEKYVVYWKIQCLL